MKVLMLGWEFPPFISGGLGTACYGLTKAMDRLGIKVTFVLPKMVDANYGDHVKLLSPEPCQSSEEFFKLDALKNVTFRTISSSLQPYLTPKLYHEKIEELHLKKQKMNRVFSWEKNNLCENDYIYQAPAKPDSSNSGQNYDGDMYSEVNNYAFMAAKLARNEQFDIIHAHDWMTYPAGIAVASITNKPLVVHVHSTEFDRSGEHVNQMIYDIERAGMHAANKIIAVSHLTRNIIITRYGISGEKVEVVHNAVERNRQWALNKNFIKKDEKIVLFLGRITMQKGPEYFLQAAKKVLEVMDDVKFVMAGSGDMMHRTIEMAAELGIGQKVLFTGFLQGEDVQKIYKMADIYVMPSVSEPFGIAPLEALENDVPVIISKQSGVSEVLTHALKVDFWDVEEMANKIVAVLKYPPLQITLRDYGNFEVRKLRWKESATKCAKIYKEALVSV